MNNNRIRRRASVSEEFIECFYRKLGFRLQEEELKFPSIRNIITEDFIETTVVENIIVKGMERFRFTIVIEYAKHTGITTSNIGMYER